MSRERRKIILCAFIMATIGALLSLPFFAGAGSLEPPPEATDTGGNPQSTMKTLNEIPPTWSQKLDASERFELVMDGEAVLDKETGLVWERSANTTWSNWPFAQGHCLGKILGNRRGWRVPTVEELNSLVDWLHRPALPNGHPFIGVQNDWYWSSNTDAADTDAAWGVDFNSGVAFKAWKGPWEAFVWCVRGGHGHDGY